MQDRRAILRVIPKLRKSCESFTSPRVGLEAGVEFKVSNRTVQRILNEGGYHYFQSHKRRTSHSTGLKGQGELLQKN